MSKLTIEQEVQIGDCLLPPPIAILTKDNVYHIKEGASQKGKIEEKSSCFCRTCCMPSFRTSQNTIEIDGKKYTSDKEFRLAYCISWLCYSRPDVIIKNNGQVVGSVEIPCLPPILCKYQMNCYKGDKRDEASLLWTIKKCACNCHTLFGKACGCCLGPAKTMDMEILDKSGKPVSGAVLQKEYFGLFNECFTMADKYNISFPSNNDDEKAIFLAAVQFMDMLWFETNYCGGGTI